MPLIIRELIIRGVVEDRSGGEGDVGREETPSADPDQLVQETVDRVMESLAEKEER